MHCTSTSVRMMLTVVFRCSTLLLGWLSDRPAATHGWSLLPVVPVTTPWNGRGPASRRFRIQRERRPHHDLALRLSNRNNNNNWNNQLDETGRRKAQSGIGETAAGAVLGGLLLGPFGALFGASIGSNIGARNAVDRAKKEDMDRLGISQDMLDMAQEIGLTLQNSNEGLSAVQDSLATQQQLARRLERDSADRYQRANAALLAGDERMAKALLFERTGLQEKQKTVLIQCVEERRRLETMQNNIAQLERKAMEIDALLQRTVSAKLLSGSKSMDSDLGLSLRPEDPLLQKFRDLGMD